MTKEETTVLRWIFRSLYRPRPVFHATDLQTLGAQGPDVTRFQELLNKRGRRYGVRVEVTGVYDERTRNSVRCYQEKVLSILNTDGFVGPQTAQRLRIRLVS